MEQDYDDGGGIVHLVCEYCSMASDYSPDDAEDGFFSCHQCSRVHNYTQTITDDYHNFPPTASIRFLRRATQPTPTPKRRSTPAPSYPTRHPAYQTPVFVDLDELSEPRDFAPGSGAWDGLEELAVSVRWRYMRGMQVILQRQLEVLVERYRVSALVCGVAGTVWLRWVAASKVFDETWAPKVLAEVKAAERTKRSAGEGEVHKPHDVNHGCEDESLIQKDRKRFEFIFLRSLRTMLPVYSTLAVSFLACHIAREAVLPTDIYRWAMEGKLPYVAAFTEVDNLLASSTIDCPLDARRLFRPVRLIGAWQLEVAAGSIAQKIGLQLPSVNFYSIAERYLSELSLPLEIILPHACRIYEWTMPAELWLSSNPAKVPARVCIMAILIVSLRILYNINGQGIWEKISEEERNAGASDPGVNSPASMQPDSSIIKEFGTREVLCALADAYEKIDVGDDYSKDLRSYLKYCKDIVFPGISYSAEEGHLINIFRDMFKEREDENPEVHMEEMQTTKRVNKRCWDGTFTGARCVSASSGIQKIKSEMEEYGFYYMPPRKWQRSDGYLYYRRKRVTGSFVCVVHADYYMLLRSFAKLAEVDIRIMHTSVLQLERRLAWIEERIGRSLYALQNLPSKANDEETNESG